MRLSAPELGDEREHRCGIARLTRQPSQDHAGMFSQGASEAGPGKEFSGLTVILGCGASHDLFEGDGEFVRVEGASFADFLPWGDGSVPGIHRVSSCSEALDGLSGSTEGYIFKDDLLEDGGIA